MAGKQYQLKITPQGSDEGLVYNFEAPWGLWAKWVKVEFQFKTSDVGYQVAHSVLTPSPMIYVRERWYHRLANWAYLKFRRSHD